MEELTQRIKKIKRCKQCKGTGQNRVWSDEENGHIMQPCGFCGGDRVMEIEKIIKIRRIK